MEATRKIVTLSDKAYAALKIEKERSSVSIEEYTLFTAMKNVMRGVGIAITSTTAYYLCVTHFGTTSINSWNKSQYNSLISVDKILSLVDDNPNVFKLENMRR